ncbi:hypothetical protein V8E54_014916 [Elaphomyces granulatus]
MWPFYSQKPSRILNHQFPRAYDALPPGARDQPPRVNKASCSDHVIGSFRVFSANLETRNRRLEICSSIASNSDFVNKLASQHNTVFEQESLHKVGAWPGPFWKFKVANANPVLVQCRHNWQFLLDRPFPGFGVVPTRRAGSRIDAQRDVAVEKFGEDLGMIEEYMSMVDHSRAQNSVANFPSPPPSVLQPPRGDQCLQSAIGILAEQPPTYHMSRGIKLVVRVDCGPWRAAVSGGPR